MHDDPHFVHGRRGLLGSALSGCVAASLPSDYAVTLPVLSEGAQEEMAHVERLFQTYEDAWREAEAASELMENSTEADGCRWHETRRREIEALHALLSYEDKSLSAFKIRADCIQALIQQNKLSRRHFGAHGDAFEVFVNSIGRF